MVVGKNVEVSMDGKVLVIRIDTADAGKPSKTGKTVLVGSTPGYVPLIEANGRLNVQFIR